MDILINSQKKLSEIQDEFQKCFQFLKIEFFTKKPIPVLEEGDQQAKMYEGKKTIGDISGKIDIANLLITGMMTVAQLEKELKEHTGIHSEVFRKSGKVWLVTSTSDDWTLDEQNHKARVITETKTIEPEKPDYHEQE